ncbi:glutathione S-transferase family protein [Novosphingobium sp. Gsoil 351]|uniref:glutathione S-transferase family protein n=1 Tax=Novosphingobium sp. Gsoil 351 TaxID=2675225 RepID=UPI0012B4E021|nr:glutathione S-transferase family protein [Novosphingobium sp. Gsoil 351]QGN53272.1 glutathione S-transferase family protein [Novosphingobium sp. Gsoil 351]
MMLALYGHPFSSYTWKALIALYANATPFEFRMVDPDHPDNSAFVAQASPLGRFPVLVDGSRTVFEATAIIDYLHLRHAGPAQLLPADPEAAVEMRMIDRVFDLSVMDVMQEIVAEHLRSPEDPDPAVASRVHDRLDRSYRWIDRWLGDNPPGDTITLVECAAAPSLFYADWVHRIPPELDRLRAWRAHLLALPPVKRCVDEARPYRAYFPLGAPDRD